MYAIRSYYGVELGDDVRGRIDEAVRRAAYTEAFGGPRYMTQDQVDFINNWEVEQYRSKISTSK